MTESSKNQPRESLEELCRQAAMLRQTSHEPIRRIRVQNGDMSVELEWPELGNQIAQSTQPHTPEPPEAHSVCSPMVGTFYLAPQPGAEPFVREGDTVVAGQQVGIVEAMKLMNAVAADRSGTVAKILVHDAAPVEHGQPLVALSLA
ncbi:acetyl-CoA carboxylase biotin carboxyl carrier protein [Nonomuraea sp. NPDC059007]|uniref:acetyl-CoA carboxylase biotin carboxyl carrier protein n=1 Tax=Nonomuraea sp. NPDC059007 TaxID=3346692 RepID=UPI0036A37AE0